MKKRLFILGFAILALAAGPALALGKKVSWGRAGVSLATYHEDALECANRAYGVDVQMAPFGPAAAGLGASRRAGAASLDTVDRLQAVVDSCLIEKGYQRFRLTAAQMRVLGTLPHGSAERERYLHRLGADPRVLSAQAI